MSKTATSEQIAIAFSPNTTLRSVDSPAEVGWYIFVAALKGGHLFPRLLWVEEISGAGFSWRTESGTFRSVAGMDGAWFQLPLDGLASAVLQPAQRKRDLTEDLVARVRLKRAEAVCREVRFAIANWRFANWTRVANLASRWLRVGGCDKYTRPPGSI